MPAQQKKRDSMSEVGFLEGLIWPERKSQFKDWLLEEARKATQLAKEKTENGASPKEKGEAVRQAWKAIIAAKRHIKG